MPGIPNLYEVLAELNEATDYTADGCTTASSSRSSRRGSRGSRSPYTLREFYAYLKASHCEENLEFFNKTRRFLVTNGHGSCPHSPSADDTYWDEQVYPRFVVVDAPAQCNLPQYIRDTFAQCHARHVRPQQADIVDAIEIVMGMLFDAYSRYLNHIQTNDHYSIASDASATSPDEGQESVAADDDDDDQMSVSQYGLDMEKLNRDIAEMTLTRSSMSVSMGTAAGASAHSLQQQQPRTLPKQTHAKKQVQQAQPQAQAQAQVRKANFITKGRMLLNRLQKRRSPSPKAAKHAAQHAKHAAKHSVSQSVSRSSVSRSSMATITN